MLGRISLTLMIALTVLNVAVLAIHLSTQSRAAVAGMDRRELKRDRDFSRAVKELVEECVVAGPRISC